MPTGKNEVVLVTDKYNRIDIAFFEKLGITENTENYKLTDFVSKTILKVIPNDDYYTKNGDLFTTAAPTDYEKLYDSDTGTKLTITGILRSKKEVSSSYLSPGIAYSTALTAAERTKEIGILRSVGARKKDISRVFNAETMIIGFTSGMIGVGLSYLLEIPINTIVSNLAGISKIASLNTLHAAALVAGSMILTLIAGFIPSGMAAKKDPVVALRSE
jgi:hypothetical protein